MAKQTISERLFAIDKLFTEIEAEFSVESFMPGKGMTADEAAAIRNGLRAVMDHIDTGDSETVVGKRVISGNPVRVWTAITNLVRDPDLGKLLGDLREPLQNLPRLTPARGKAAAKAKATEPVAEVEATDEVAAS